MLLLILACSDRGTSPPPPVPAAPVGMDGLGGGTTTMGIPIPPRAPPPPRKSEVCPEWADGVVVPSALSIVECTAGRVAMTGLADVVAACGEVHAELVRAGWEQRAAGVFRYELTRGSRKAELFCAETPAGIVVTLAAEYRERSPRPLPPRFS